MTDLFAYAPPMAAGRGLLITIILVLIIVAIIVWLASHRRGRY